MTFLSKLLRSVGFRLSRVFRRLRSGHWARLVRSAGGTVGSGFELRRGARIDFGKPRRLELGTNVTLAENAAIFVRDGAELVIEDDVFVGAGSFLVANGSLRIGKGTQIAHYVTLIDSDHEYRDRSLALLAQGGVIKSIEIGSQVWIGANSVILKGRKIGDHAVIGAGSVVTKDVAQNSVVAGNPASPIG